MTVTPSPSSARRAAGRCALLLLATHLAACGGGEPSGPAGTVDTQGDSLSSTGLVPLMDLRNGATYLGFTGGLYLNGNNTPPAAHHEAGRLAAASIRPLDINGQPSANGRYVLLSIGMSNTTQEFCSQTGAEPCNPWTFMGRAAADASVNKTTLDIVNGARGGQTASTWDSPSDTNYDRVRDTVLAPQGLSEKQVQVVWIKVANATPTVSLPAANADAYQLEVSIGNVLRAAKARYPNLKQAFLSTRIYGGYATTGLNPEPYAYESGFAAKWAIEAQMRQKFNGTVDPQAGNLDYDSGIAPWVAWGPYLWADGLTPRSDGLTWAQSDFASDGTHPSQSGQSKVGHLLLNFFKSSPYTRCWFLAGQTCP